MEGTVALKENRRPEEPQKLSAAGWRWVVWGQDTEGCLISVHALEASSSRAPMELQLQMKAVSPKWNPTDGNSSNNHG